MIGDISSRDGRTLGIGAAIIASMVGLSLGVPRYLSWRAAALTDAARETAALARVEASIARFTRTTTAFASARQSLSVLDSLLLPGASVSAAGTALAAAISEAAEGAEAQLGSIQVRRDSTGRTRLTRIAARASVSGDVESLALFLESLEAGPPLLAVREWSISGGSPTIAATQPMALRLDVLVEGIARTSSREGSR